MIYIQKYFSSFWEMTLLMHAYIIFCLIVAGVIKEFLSDEYIKKNLGGTGLWAVVKATLLGLPLPLCSCGVIPLAASLRKSGAGKGAVTSFFISTPMTGADSIIATYGVFGWIITLFRVVSASIAAILAGFFTDKFTGDDEFAGPSGCGCSGGCCCTVEVAKPTAFDRVKGIFRYAFVELLGDLAYPLLAGLLMAALITLFITPEITGNRTGIVFGYLLAFTAGVPLYVCSISAIPIALSFLVAGFSPGAAFIFLAAAPATNIIALSVVKNMLGKRGVAIYLTSIILVTLATALIVDYLYLNTGLSFNGFTGEDEAFGMLETVTASAFLIIITLISLKQKLFRKNHNHH
ncbi:MAG: permease [Denitrovibrio sp.]|nr:MAG: permease [Denitrovibrio sp.]